MSGNALASSRDGPVKVGDVVAGKYRVDSVLGSSGMGIVYRAMHVDIEQPVAIKFLLDPARDPHALPRFKREAKALGRVQSDHVVRVLDVGEHEGAPFIVMEYLAGEDLLRTLRARAIPISETCDILLQVCEGLAAAHAAGCIHRDLKPSNILLVPRPDGSRVAKIIDFGVAKLRDVQLETDSGTDSLTHTNTLIGSPRYMSPEQVGASRSVDARTDVWSLGVILYEMLSGRAAFRADNISQLLVMILTKEPTPLQELRADLPPPLVALVARSMSKDPATRTASVAEFAAALAPFATARADERISRIAHLVALPVPSSPSISGTFPPVHSSPDIGGATTTGWEDGPPKAPRRARWAAVAAALLLGALAGGAAFLRFHANKPSPSPAVVEVAAKGGSVPVPPPTVPVVATKTVATTALDVTDLPKADTTSPKVVALHQRGSGPSHVSPPPSASVTPAVAAPPPPPATTATGAMFDDPR